MKSIVILDIETTGTGITTDRVVQLACKKITFDGAQPITKNILINPGISIPKQATEVHGITDENVAGLPSFGQYAKALFEFFKDCDYGGFNLIQFDIPMLAEEFARCGIEWPAAGAKYYDAFHVFREKQKRDLSAAVFFYLGVAHTDAHNAMGDVEATWEVIKAQMDWYDDIKDFEEYAKFCENPNALDLAGKIVLDETGMAVFSFGKHEGKSVKANKKYAEWMLSADFSKNTKNIIRSLLLK